jgi:hypothetical protein
MNLQQKLFHKQVAIVVKLQKFSPDNYGLKVSCANTLTKSLPHRPNIQQWHISELRFKVIFVGEYCPHFATQTILLEFRLPLSSPILVASIFYREILKEQYAIACVSPTHKNTANPCKNAIEIKGTEEIYVIDGFHLKIIFIFLSNFNHR